MLKFAVVVFFVHTVLSVPVDQNTPIAIVSQKDTNDGAGNFGYSFETANGIKESIQGTVKQIQVPKLDAKGQVVGQEPGLAVVQSGNIAYPSPDGTVIQLSFVADENGFQPKGDHLPVAPVA